MRRLADIRSTFIDFFKANGHEPVASSSLVPSNDPTLLFTNAGMVQFKDVFVGAEKRPYTRATSSQKCVRAGGKHNDLENVGYTARHHTFFEMLGNFSFGDYFKEEAIHYAWTLITKEFGLNADKLVVTVYHDDEEAATLWKKIAGFPDHKIIRIATADNFWSMGDTGPCGPCTEIFYDHGEGIPGGPPGSPDEDGDRFTEFWNLVFMQYEQRADGTRINLPKPSVDTGMGIERFTSIMQGVHNNYDTDLFKTIIEESMELTRTTDPKFIQSHRVIADHLRASAFLLADGVLPSNEGRGYVLRRIMRRGMRHAHLLGAKEPLMHRMVSVLVDLMSGAYPELIQTQSLITENLRLEEERFRQTLERGLKLLEDETTKLKPQEPLAGTVAFKLYDTFGFPLDLTQDVLRGQNRSVELDGFTIAMKVQQAAARAAWSGSGDTKNDQIWYDLHEKVGATEFLGYDSDEGEAFIQALVVQGKSVDALSAGQQGQMVGNQTPCYAESGGQEGDRGWIEGSSGKAQILDTVKMVGGLHVHKIEMTEGSLKAGGQVKITIDRDRRRQLRAHHSATHLLHGALRKHLGSHVNQKGSLVAQDRLRFDFTHTKPLTQEELDRIEQDVNDQVLGNSPVQTHLMTSEEATKKGAMALFGEKYGDEVRVLSMGTDGDHAYSVELCGGTHVHRTGDIGLIKILSEVGVSAGIRRIEAVAGEQAYQYVRDMQRQIAALMDQLKCPANVASAKLAVILLKHKSMELELRILRPNYKILESTKNELEQELKGLQQELALLKLNNSNRPGNPTEVQPNLQELALPVIKNKNIFGNLTVTQSKIITRQFQDIPAKDLKPLADQLKVDIKSGVIILTSVVEGKVALVIAVTADLCNRISAVDLVRVGAEALGGKGGGGRPDMAQAGGNDPALVEGALAAVKAMIEKS